MKLRQFLKQQLVSKEIDSCVDQIPKPVGSFGFDPWGYNVEGAKVWMACLKPIYDYYFRVQPFGLENIPKQGRVLLIANHSGQIPMDGTLIGMAMVTNPNGPRAPRVMVERWVPTIPFIGNALNEVGGVIGDPVNCIKMLRNEEAVVVFPEGVRGSGKPFKDRYQLKRFGHGFMHIAIEENTPIIPVGVVGCEESLPSLGNLKPVAKMLGMPYLPICLPFPLPTKVFLTFGEPLYFSGDIECEEEVDKKVAQVKDAIRQAIANGLNERKHWFA